MFQNMKWWEHLIPGYAQWRYTENLFDDAKQFVGSTARELITGKTDKQRALEEQQASSAQQQALDHSEMREDTAIQRRVDDLKAAGINPVFAGSSMGAADSSASQAAVYSKTQEQQAQAQQTQALASLLSSAAMLFMSRGKGIPIQAASSAKRSTYINNAYYVNR